MGRGARWSDNRTGEKDRGHLRNSRTIGNNMARIYPAATGPEIETPEDPGEAWRKIKEDAEGSDEGNEPDENDGE